MEENEIKIYFDKILIPKLREVKVNEEYIQSIVDNIETQMYSVLKHWNDAKFRETILFLGFEEGNFYKPRDASLKVKCFVVVTIRNSLLETIASVDYKRAGMEAEIEDEDVMEITMNAVKYYNSVNLREVANKLDYSKHEDIYLTLSTKYKMAWNALMELCFCVGKEKNYEKITDYNRMYLKDLQPREKVNLKGEKSFIEIQSGISPSYSNELISTIDYIINDVRNKFFFSDSFKQTTRNIEKLLQIIEILLQRGKVYLTNNYYIANNYVAKRTKILRAAHTTGEVKDKLAQLNNLAQCHSEALEKIIGMM